MKISGTDLGIVGDLLAYEIDLTNPADGRRVISEERVGVMASAQLYASGRITADQVRERGREAARVLAMWQAPVH